ncbi:DUF2637 domain-containing protein [Micromonospora radicis]|uniref:DUF2637 domain-containing protein n=1 Tax=Micromonospora radicis TaxID=1894971 RepID=A0A418MMI8_9ACTN|nr:DUF2637 domain-containing protein [Micromonospora radicis]RIV29786.1 DUF2637 domain-containing protein [Micromonospora radicis]
MLAIGGAAGAASFTHVHNVAAAHGQPGWLAWADAIVLELMSIASGLELRRRKRAGVSTVFPAAVLACAVTLSLAAQVVEAEPSPIGWIAAAVPALGFLVMVKIALGYTDTTPTPTHSGTAAPIGPSADQSTPIDPARSGGDRDAPSTPPSADPSIPAWTVPDTTARHPDNGPDGPRPRSGGPVRRGRSSRRGPSPHPTEAEELLPAARRAQERLAAQGQPLTRTALAAALRAAGHTVSNKRASQLLKILKAERHPTPSTPAGQPPDPADGSTPPATPELSTATTTSSPIPQPPAPQSGDPTP